jgi:cold shock protein
MFRVFAKSTNWGIVLTGMEGLMTRMNGPDPKWYNVEKVFVFVASDRGGKDVFVHAPTLDRSGLSELPEGQRVRLQISQGQKGPETRSIELLD